MNQGSIRIAACYTIAAALAVLFFAQVLFQGETFYFRDIHRWFYPMKYFLAESFRNGEIPVWCSSYLCGAPFLSDIQSGVFYPLSLLFRIFPFPLSFNLYVCVHFFLGFVFCHRFFTHAGHSWRTALFAATAFCYGGYVISSINTLNNLSTAIWMPAILWRSQLSLQKRNSPGQHLATVLILAMAILGAEPLLFIVSVGLGLLWAAVENRRIATGIQIRRCALFLLLVAAAVSLAMVQLGPTYLDYRMSSRQGGIDFGMATQYSLQPQTLQHLFLPLRFPPNFETSMNTLSHFFSGNGKIPWLLTIYPGFLVAPLALLGLVTKFSAKNLFWFAIFTVSLLLALGSHTPVYYIAYKLLPFFRFPEKFMLTAGFALICLAATGLDFLFGFLKGKNIRPALVFSLLWVALVADLFWAHRHLNPTCEPDFYHTYHPNLEPIFDDPGTFRVYVDPKISTPDAGHKRLANFHARWQLIQMPHLGIISGIDHVDGQTGMELRYQYIIYKLMTLPWPEKIGILRIANVKYIITQTPLERIDILKNRVEKLTPILYRLTDSLPRACMLGNSEPSHRFSVLDLASEAFDPAATVLAEGEIVHRHTTPSFQNVDTIDYTRPGEIRIGVDAKKPGLLFLSESFYPGWRVSVDGHPREVLKLNILFQGVEVGPGRHTVIFSYHPPHLPLFSAISILSAICVVLLWLKQKRGKPMSRKSL